MQQSRPSQIDPAVFWPAMIIIVGFVAWGTIFPDSPSSISTAVLGAIISGFGWNFARRRRVTCSGFRARPVSRPAAPSYSVEPFGRRARAARMLLAKSGEPR